jgi:hypothetical protein
LEDALEPSFATITPCPELECVGFAETLPIKFFAVGLVRAEGIRLAPYERLVRPDKPAGLADGENPLMTLQLAALPTSPPGEATLEVPTLRAEPAALAMKDLRRSASGACPAAVFRHRAKSIGVVTLAILSAFRADT